MSDPSPAAKKYPASKNDWAPSPEFAGLLGIIALTLWLGFQVASQIAERGRLQAAWTAQEPQVQESLRQRQQLQGLAGDTAALAEGGNANAKQIVESMKEKGITMTAPGAAPAK
ncbi:MAG TPA: hypothetical protein VKT70_11315 [Stellaceae bacterium]|nr:hypothetical protein [Stellaceae bacterium]